MGVYTKRGDKGDTATLNDKKTSKNSPVIRAIGNIDEAASYIGVCKSEADDDDLIKILISIQIDLFTINAKLAGSKMGVKRGRITFLERLIDDLENELPVLFNFIIPGNEKLSAKLFYARTVIRRSERVVVGMGNKEIFENELVYLNRLSDALFVLARYVLYERGVKEEVWKPRA